MIAVPLIVRTCCRWLTLALCLSSLAGCKLLLLHPFGDIADQEGQLILQATYLMLLIIVPVIALTLLFAWRYRASNTDATYKPNWDHSTQLELVIWAAPLMIIIALGAITWINTHTLDPYRELGRIDAKRAVPAEAEPLVIEAVALDWKWLFFYPQQGIATVNEIAAPVDRPITFKITASNVMNSFYIPALAGQIYAMPGMETKLHAVINGAGSFEGFSANYSGAGFSQMRFRFKGVSQTDFDDWIASVKSSGNSLTRDAYRQLARPSIAEPVRLYANAAPNLYHDILNLCTEPGTMCMDHMMAVDMGMMPNAHHHTEHNHAEHNHAEQSEHENMHM